MKSGFFANVFRIQDIACIPVTQNVLHIHPIVSEEMELFVVILQSIRHAPKLRWQNRWNVSQKCHNKDNH